MLSPPGTSPPRGPCGAGWWVGSPPPQEGLHICLLRFCGLSAWTVSGDRAGLSDYQGPATWRFLSLLVRRRGLEDIPGLQQFLNTSKNEPHGTKKPQLLRTKVRRQPPLIRQRRAYTQGGRMPGFWSPPRAQLLISLQQEAQELRGRSPLAGRGCRATSPGEGGELTGPLGHNSDTWPTSPTQHKPCPGNTTGGQPAPSSWPACGRFGEVSTGEPQLAGWKLTAGSVSPASPVSTRCF